MREEMTTKEWYRNITKRERRNLILALLFVVLFFAGAALVLKMVNDQVKVSIEKTKILREQARINAIESGMVKDFVEQDTSVIGNTPEQNGSFIIKIDGKDFELNYFTKEKR